MAKWLFISNYSWLVLPMNRINHSRGGTRVPAMRCPVVGAWRRHGRPCWPTTLVPTPCRARSPGQRKATQSLFSPPTDRHLIDVFRVLVLCLSPAATLQRSGRLFWDNGIWSSEGKLWFNSRGCTTDPVAWRTYRFYSWAPNEIVNHLIDVFVCIYMHTICM